MSRKSGKMRPLPKGIIVTGNMRGIMKMDALVHPDCLWILASTGTRSEIAEAGYVQDVRCLRHDTLHQDVDGVFLRERAEESEIEAFTEALGQEILRLQHAVKFLRRKLQLFKEM